MRVTRWPRLTSRSAASRSTVSEVPAAAARFLEIAGDDAKAITELRDAEERAHALHSLGLAPGQAVPAALRPQLKALEDDQKRRATRSLRDGIDRILVDLGSLYRDVLLIQLDAEVDLVNREIAEPMRRAAASATPAQTLATLDAIQEARERIEGNVQPALALEAMLVSAIRTTVNERGAA